MSYQIRFEGKALVQLKGLPFDAFDAQTTFGHGYGLLTFRVDDNAELIRIFDILWVG